MLIRNTHSFLYLYKLGYKLYLYPTFIYYKYIYFVSEFDTYFDYYMQWAMDFM